MSVFKSHIDAMSAYKPPLDGRDPHKHLLLDFNERTQPVADVVRQALIDYINSGRLQMYPAYGDITDKIAGYAGVAADQVMITNGSDQGIDLVIRAACREGDEAIIPGPSFAMYKQVALVENLTIIEPQYSREKGFPLAETLAAINDKTRLITVSNPNNPSGTLVSRDDIVTIAKAAPEAVILVDECYFEYASVTVADLVGLYPNLVVTRTFSKTWGIPSLRLGYIIAAAENVRALLNVRGPYDINQLAIVAIRAALDNLDTVESYVDEVMQVSKPMLEAFLDAKGIDYWPSGGNYLWSFPANPLEINAGLLDAGILVRPKADSGGRMGLRITLGDKLQTERLLGVLDGLI
ncbi:pyridoxal phosphate-dependent aminotransferase [Teredinibacter waterburyi]|uniref:pyridoxal phosphate-dependent aminotransferase n=1 Tax=Teredinibacter waterburyi TaxID=1500538 RepID=UPI00165F264C|nr:histidinol-phosphate transaminase [Teredinibacter waterburyi]